ncbi:Na+/H+ antiporter NhaD-like permease [Thiovulum sp. ES]|nr:Na+/H+ antiporter NhaD-like permease [Thiovulum sp. ES]
MSSEWVDLSTTAFGFIMLGFFVVGYFFIATEEQFKIDKAKPALFLGTSMFIFIGFYYHFNGYSMGPLEHEIDHLILEIAEIFFFLYVAMTFIEALVDRKVFDVLKHNLISKGYTYRQLFWVTGFIAFFLSPVADNLTTALILSTVLITLEKERKDFLVPGAINIVVAANAGGAWSPFGDITTLMAWTAGKGAFVDFMFLFPASILGWLATAFILSKFVPQEKPKPLGNEEIPTILPGGKKIIYLGVFTIATAVLGKQLFHLPPMWGMLFGLSILKLYSYSLKEVSKEANSPDIFHAISKIEHNTLIFFVGILGAVGALHFLGFLNLAVQLYDMYSPTAVNIGVGVLSAIVDNVPVMSAVLKANPEIGLDQWMLVTLTAGVGGSLISFGSAAGVGVMGRMHGIYTFGSHMKYAWTVAIGYIVSVSVWYLQFEVLHLYMPHAVAGATGTPAH